MIRKALRSVLFCPGDKSRVLTKAKDLRCDAMILDLEDAVLPDKKIVARQNAGEFAASWAKSERNKQVVVRINDLNTPFGKEDLKAFSLQSVDAILVPKASSFTAIDEYAKLLKDAGNEHTPIWCNIETPFGVHNVVEIASHPRVECLVFGSNDLTKDLRAKHVGSREPLLYSMSRCILAARMYGKVVIDGVYNNFEDLDGLMKSSIQGKQLGFDGKALIHPKQIDVCHAAYSPSSDDVRRAKSIVSAWNDSVKAGKSVAIFEGVMIEELHYQEALQMIKDSEEV